MTTKKRICNKNASINSSFLLLICFVLVTSFTILLFSSKVNAKEREGNFTITSKKISLPTDEDFKTLEECFNELSVDFAELQELKDEIENLYNEVETAKVCSIANRNFNSLEECFNAYEEKLSKVKEYFASYKGIYDTYISSIEELPKFSYLYRERQEEFSNFTSTYNYLYEQSQEYILAENELYELYMAAKTIADDFFEEYYEPICCLVHVESGNCSAEEQYYTAQVVEHRIMYSSEVYPDNLYDVIHQPGQYSTVASGKYDRAIPSDDVSQNMADFLRGHIETGMPSNVVFQSRSIQGDIWWASPSGQYFCYRK